MHDSGEKYQVLKMESVVTNDSENEINIKDKHEKGTSEIVFGENPSTKYLKTDNTSTDKNQESDKLCVEVTRGGYGFRKVTRLANSCEF